jgi:multiple sugar transport system permease protein
VTLFGRAGSQNLEAGAVIAMIPCVVLYIARRRYYIRGLTSGVVKG